MSQLISKAFNLFDESSNSKYEQNGLRTFALEMANNGYAEICRETQCCWTSGTISLTANIREYSLPAACAILDTVVYSYSRLKPMFNKDINLSLTGPPTQYYVMNDKIGFDALPNDNYTVSITYFAGPSADLVLSDSPTLIPDRWQYVLAYYIARRLFEVDKGANPNQAILWQNLYMEELSKMRNYFRLGGNASEIPEML